MKIKKTSKGYELDALITTNGTITIPVNLRELVGKGLGDTIHVIVPEKQA
jgi:bifunctional DNA-binding transcriptional regulator/antitoxin component of YhaV-PrlF toxin-antitoxin module